MKQTFIVNGIDILKQNDELKQENEKLKEENHYLNSRVKGEIHLGNCYKKDFAEEATRAETYKQALEEIKKYVNSHLDGFGNAVYGITKNQITTITNKINEVLK